MIDQALSTSRRAFVAGLAATTVSLAGPATAFAAAKRRAAVAPISALFATFADEILSLSPENATGLGLDSGKHANLRAMLDQAGNAWRDKAAAQFSAMRARLDKLDDSKLTPRQQLQGDTVDYALNRAQDGARFAYGGGASDGFQGGATPYVLTQQNGAITSISEFLNSQHPVKTTADAEAYLARVAAFGRVLDQESEQIRNDADKGVMPPAFVAKTALGQLQEFRAMKAADQSMVASLATRAKAAGLQV